MFELLLKCTSKVSGSNFSRSIGDVHRDHNTVIHAGHDYYSRAVLSGKKVWQKGFQHHCKVIHVYIKHSLETLHINILKPISSLIPSINDQNINVNILNLFPNLSVVLHVGVPKKICLDYSCLHFWVKYM